MFKSVAIVGSSGGIGSEACRFVSERYAPENIFEFSRSGQWALEHSTKILMDICDEASIDAAISQIPESISFDLVFVATGQLHNDAQGIMPEKALQHLSSANFLNTLQVNTVGPSLVAKSFIPKLRKDNTCIFAALSARVGSVSDNKLGGWYSYRAAKAALNMMIKSISIETSRRNKHAIIIGIHPGTVDTGLSKPFQKNIKPEKIFTPQFSVSKIFEIFENVTVDQTGCCFAWDGSVIQP